MSNFQYALVVCWLCNINFIAELHWCIHDLLFGLLNLLGRMFLSIIQAFFLEQNANKSSIFVACFSIGIKIKLVCDVTARALSTLNARKNSNIDKKKFTVNFWACNDDFNEFFDWYHLVKVLAFRIHLIFKIWSTNIDFRPFYHGAKIFVATEMERWPWRVY